MKNLFVLEKLNFMKITNFIFLLFFSAISIAQDIPVGAWRSHFSYNDALDIEETKDRIFCVAESGMYSVDKVSGEFQTYSKVQGFAEFQVARIKYADSLGLLLIAYANTNLDILTDKGEIFNISDITRKQILGEKRINSINIIGELAYLSCTFGIVVVDLNKKEIKDSYLNIGPGGTSLKINSTEVFQDYLYAATNNGIYRASVLTSNLSDFNSWVLFETSISNSNHLKYFGGKLFATIDSVRYTFDGNIWQSHLNSQKNNVVSIQIHHKKLIIAQHGKILIINENGLEREQNENQINDALVDENGNIWSGGFSVAMFRIDKKGQYYFYRPNGPKTSQCFDIVGHQNKVWVSGGGYNQQYAPNYSSNGFYQFIKGRWQNTNASNSKIFSQYALADFTNIVADETNSHIWFGTHGRGLIETVNGEVLDVYDSRNSTLKPIVNDLVYVTGIAFDSKNNLWISNYGGDTALSVRRRNGKFNSFSIPKTNVGEIVIDKLDQKWMLLPFDVGGGIGVFKEIGEIATGEFQFRTLTTVKGNGNLPSNNVNALASDKNGEIWVGTEQGLTVFYNPRDIFLGGQRADAQKIIIDDGKDIGYLLGTEYINDIKVDGANNKWVATNNGAWYIEQDGEKVVRHFTKENSPLPSNKVNAIGINPISGEVFFGTELGIISYRGQATGADNSHQKVKIFPNPIRPNYTGFVTISGLPENAFVKITDIAGNLVYEMRAQGGTAIWERINLSGERPKTGIYLVFSANQDGEETMVNKFLLVN